MISTPSSPPEGTWAGTPTLPSPSTTVTRLLPASTHSHFMRCTLASAVLTQRKDSPPPPTHHLNTPPTAHPPPKRPATEGGPPQHDAPAAPPCHAALRRFRQWPPVASTRTPTANRVEDAVPPTTGTAECATSSPPWTWARTSSTATS